MLGRIEVDEYVWYIVKNPQDLAALKAQHIQGREEWFGEPEEYPVLCRVEYDDYRWGRYTTCFITMADVERMAQALQEARAATEVLRTVGLE